MRRNGKTLISNCISDHLKVKWAKSGSKNCFGRHFIFSICRIISNCAIFAWKLVVDEIEQFVPFGPCIWVTFGCRCSYSHHVHMVFYTQFIERKTYRPAGWSINSIECQLGQVKTAASDFPFAKAICISVGVLLCLFICLFVVSNSGQTFLFRSIGLELSKRLSNSIGCFCCCSFGRYVRSL